jgi:hypothetical protein
MKFVSRSLALALLAVAGVVPASADGVQDYYVQRYKSNGFDLVQNADSFAMAGSTLATMSGSGAVAANPAGLGWMKDAEISLGYAREYVSGNDINTYADVEAVTNSGHVLAVIPVGPYADATPEYGSLGLGWSKHKANGDDSGNLDLDGYRLHLAYGIDLSDDLALGYSISYHYTELFSGGNRELKMNDGLRNSVGLQYKLDQDTLLGVSTAFGFGKYKAETGGNEKFDVHSFNLTTGLQQKLSDSLTGAVGVDYTNYSSEFAPDAYQWNFRTGVEQDYGMLQVRAGYRYAALFARDSFLEGLTSNAKFNAVSFGLGVKLDSGIHFDYASEYRHVGDGDWTHMVSAAVPFSICEDA